MKNFKESNSLLSSNQQEQSKLAVYSETSDYILCSPVNFSSPASVDPFNFEFSYNSTPYNVDDEPERHLVSLEDQPQFMSPIDLRYFTPSSPVSLAPSKQSDINAYNKKEANLNKDMDFLSTNTITIPANNILVNFISPIDKIKSGKEIQRNMEILNKAPEKRKVYKKYASVLDEVFGKVPDNKLKDYLDKLIREHGNNITKLRSQKLSNMPYKSLANYIEKRIGVKVSNKDLELQTKIIKENKDKFFKKMLFLDIMSSEDLIKEIQRVGYKDFMHSKELNPDDRNEYHYFKKNYLKKRGIDDAFSHTSDIAKVGFFAKPANIVDLNNNQDDDFEKIAKFLKENK